jgi:hypothetical protein
MTKWRTRRFGQPPTGDDITGIIGSLFGLADTTEPGRDSTV